MRILALATAIVLMSSGTVFAQEDPPLDCANAQTQADTRNYDDMQQRAFNCDLGWRCGKFRTLLQ